MTRAKFQCTKKEIVTDSGWDSQAGASTTKEVANIELFAVTAEGGDENKAFFKSTPNGNITLSIVNLPAAEMFEQGKDYYVDFTPAA